MVKFGKSKRSSDESGEFVVKPVTQVVVADSDVARDCAKDCQDECANELSVSCARKIPLKKRSFFVVNGVRFAMGLLGIGGLIVVFSAAGTVLGFFNVKTIGEFLLGLGKLLGVSAIFVGGAAAVTGLGYLMEKAGITPWKLVDR